MTFPSWGRLAKLYQDRMFRLFGGNLWELLRNPDLVRDPVFQHRAQVIAGAMAGEVAKANATSWREAAMKYSRGLEIHQALRSEIRRGGIAPTLQEIAQRNADLISSVPTEIAQRITARAAELHQNGARAEVIAGEIKRMAPHLLKSKVKMIARTEVSRAETDLTRARSENLGLNWYQWLSSEDSRVRPSHKNMNKVLVSWNDAPSPESLIGENSTLGHYHAGACPYCRCLAAPIADLDEISWPARVYSGGAVKRMSRTQFLRMQPVRLAA